MLYDKVHFEESQFESHRLDGKRKLKHNAIPALFNIPNPPPSVTVKRQSTYTLRHGRDTSPCLLLRTLKQWIHNILEY